LVASLQELEVTKLSRASSSDNMELLQWLYKSFKGMQVKDEGMRSGSSAVVQ
jgi:hypothetical protein